MVRKVRPQWRHCHGFGKAESYAKLCRVIFFNYLGSVIRSIDVREFRWGVPHRTGIRRPPLFGHESDFLLQEAMLFHFLNHFLQVFLVVVG